MVSSWDGAVAIMNRKAIEHWCGTYRRAAGLPPLDLPPDLAYRVHDGREYRTVTWAEVMQERRRRQAERLAVKRGERDPVPRAHKLWVAYFDQEFFGGWQAMVGDFRGRGYEVWIDRDCTWMQKHLMRLLPLVLPLWDDWQQWDLWKQAFAQQFERRRQHGHPLGVALIWWDRQHAPRIASRCAQRPLS